MKITLSQNNNILQKGGVGIDLEDVNCTLDGGLYAQMLENNSFEAERISFSGEHAGLRNDGVYGWNAYPDAESAALKVKTDRPLYPENPHYMRLTVLAAGAGLENSAYGGICLKAEEYTLSFYARAYGYRGAARVGVYAGATPLIEKKVKLKADGKWRRYSFRLKSKTQAENACFRFTLCEAGVVHLDCFSLMPRRAVLGVFRRDLVDLLKECKPAYLRFPGERVSEGLNARSRYPWKFSIGQTERRKHIPNPWASEKSEQTAHAGQSLGAGFYELFRLAEYLGAKPVPVVSAGLNAEDDGVDYLQDALDVVEFACGDPDTLWGSVRAEAGHPEPFGLEYLAISGKTEEGASRADCNRFRIRLAEFAEKIRAQIGASYPDIKIITNGCGGEVISNVRVSGAETRLELPNQPCVFELAEETPQGALNEAALLTQGEKNGNVCMIFRLPLMARENYQSWGEGLIRFNSSSACPNANYHVWKLFGNFTGDLRINAETDGEGVNVSATERDSFTYLKVANPTDLETEVEITGDYDFGSLAQIIRLTETDAAPVHIAPEGERTFALAPRSFFVLVFKK